MFANEAPINALSHTALHFRSSSKCRCMAGEDGAYFLRSFNWKTVILRHHEHKTRTRFGNDDDSLPHRTPNANKQKGKQAWATHGEPSPSCPIRRSCPLHKKVDRELNSPMAGQVLGSARLNRHRSGYILRGRERNVNRTGSSTVNWIGLKGMFAVRSWGQTEDAARCFSGDKLNRARFRWRELFAWTSLEPNRRADSR